MRRIIWLSFLFLLLLIFASPTRAIYEPSQPTPSPEFVPNEFIVKYKEGQTPQELFSKVTQRKERAKNFFGRLQNLTEDVTFRLSGKELPEQSLEKLTVLEKDLQITSREAIFEEKEKPPLFLKSYYLLKTSKGVETAIQDYQGAPGVESVQPNYIYQILETPNDSYFPQMWGLKKIQMEKAWDLTKGSGEVIVAVLDTGIDYNHTDFVGREIIKGPDYAYGDSDPLDGHGHGTHVSGTIGAVTNNSVGVAGINWQVKIMAIKVLRNSGSGTTTSIMKGVTYAADNGAKVINMSLGGPPVDPAVAAPLEYAASKGVTIVAAAGNSNANAGSFFPANHPKVIAVGATNQNDGRASFSNYGEKVTVSAPGVYILSTYINSAYKTASGTSMASPHVAGLAALILAKNPSFSPEEVKNTLVTTADTITTDKPVGGRINACRALGGTDCAGTPLTPTPTLFPGVTPTPTLTPTPTVPPTPTPTSQPGKANLEFNIKFQGISPESLKTNKVVKVILKKL